MQKPAGEVGKDRRAKRTPTELRLRRDALQGQTFFDFVSDLDNLIGTQPAPTAPPVGGEDPVAAEKKISMKKQRRRKPLKRSAMQ
jgi:hypothetical protein